MNCPDNHTLHDRFDRYLRHGWPPRKTEFWFAASYIFTRNPGLRVNASAMQASGFLALAAAVCPVAEKGTQVVNTVEAAAHDPEAAALAAAERIDEVSTLPHVAVRVMETANDERSGASELKAVLEADASLSARVLRAVNSSAYALRTKVTNLQTAIAYLGFKQVRNLAITASVSDIFKREDAIGEYRRHALWKHLVAVGICARLIALRRRLAEFEDAFLAGLLHDLGIILIDQHLHAPFRDVIKAVQPGIPLCDTERSVLGFDHTLLGEHIAEKWRFPPAVTASVRHHHGSHAYKGPHIMIVRCVEVANLICTMKAITSVGTNLIRPTRYAIDGLSLSRQDIEVLAADLDQEILKHSDLFAL